MALILPNIIGHRGCAGYAPENTLEGIHTAADMGVEWVELDVKLTKDQVPIIFHDDDAGRTTDTTGPIALMTYDEIRELDAGSWFGESFIGAKIPTLEEAVDVLIERGLGVNFEIKPCPSREKETAEAALDILSTIWDDHDKLLISSFSHVSLEVAFDMAETWNRGFLLPDSESEVWMDNWEELAKYLKVSSINLNGNTATRDQVEAALDLDVPVLAYTINEPDRGRFLQAWGVDGFFSDVPDVLQETLFVVH
ncbi:MAG: glycerophosphoryl diester phosphodiesterase [Alphaproteobacteria bacterium]|nr:glycerophosphoryl diester phosphodiesterase [Alphaproteobacteria bacterium]